MDENLIDFPPQLWINRPSDIFLRTGNCVHDFSQISRAKKIPWFPSGACFHGEIRE
jgi:hypothetical protein